MGNTRAGGGSGVGNSGTPAAARAARSFAKLAWAADTGKVVIGRTYPLSSCLLRRTSPADRHCCP